MAKYKITKKGGIPYLAMKRKRGEEINIRELETISAHMPDGLLPIIYFQKKKEKLLMYNISSVVKLCDYMEKVINRNVFFGMVKSIIQTLKDCDRLHLDYRKMRLNYENVYIEPFSGVIKFVYAPLLISPEEGNIVELLNDLVLNAQFNMYESSTYVDEYLEYFISAQTFSIYDFEHFIHYLETGQKLGESDGDREKNKKNPLQYDPFQEVGRVETDTVQSRIRQGPYKEPERIEKSKTETSGGYQKVQQEEEDATFLLAIEDSDRTVLFEPEEIVRHSLIRIKTNEKILLEKFPFRIGKSADNNYSLSDNNVISRQHVILTEREHKLFVRDVGSKNHTYLNEQCLEVNQEVGMEPETILRLANEEFLYKKEEKTGMW